MRTAPRPSSWARRCWMGWLSGETPVAQTSATVSSASVSPGSAGASRPTAVPGRCSGAHRRHHPGRPQRRPPVDPEAAERPRRGQRLGLRGGEPHAAGEVGEVAERAAALAFGVDRLGEVQPDRAHLGQPQPDGQAARAAAVAVQDRLGAPGVDVGADRDHPVPPRVGHQRLRRVEAHRLGVQQRRAERRRVVELEPRAVVDERREADRVALREAEVGERQHLVEDLSAPRSPVMSLAAMPSKNRSRSRSIFSVGALGAHRAAQLVGVGRGEPGDVDRDLHELLLEQRHPEGLLQRASQQRVVVGAGSSSPLRRRM